MNVSDVKNHIKTKQFDCFYIFTGEDWKVQQIYIQQIAKVSGLKCRYVNAISDVWGKIVNKSIFDDTSIFVVRDDIDILNNEKLQLQLNMSVLNDNIIILLLTNADKRTKFYKKYQDIIVTFEHLKPEILKKYIQKEIRLSDKNTNILMEICENDYGRCLLEIDKIKRYAYSIAINKSDINHDYYFRILLDNGDIYIPPRDMIFDFIDNILNADVNNAFELYNECIECGESRMVMLSVLYTNAKQVLQVQSCNSKDIEKATGLTKWQIKNAKKHLNIFSNRELINIMSMCQKCEKGIKTGEIDEEYSMLYILTNIDW